MLKGHVSDGSGVIITFSFVPGATYIAHRKSMIYIQHDLINKEEKKKFMVKAFAAFLSLSSKAAEA